MDTNILAASFAGGMIGGLTGAYIASRSYKKDVIKRLDEKSSPESDETKSSSEENNKSSEEQKTEENKASTEEQKTEDNKKSSKDSTEAKHVDAEIVGVDPTASINDDKEEK